MYGISLVRWCELDMPRMVNPGRARPIALALLRTHHMTALRALPELRFLSLATDMILHLGVATSEAVTGAHNVFHVRITLELASGLLLVA